MLRNQKRKAMITCLWICIVISYFEVQAGEDELKALIVIFRHGDRTPIQPYPRDPYRNSSYWPVDFGQLTNVSIFHKLSGNRNS
ncbi:hypothetical protein JTB14_006810 [Gonioctena quinquepunctata]|nr:hypothetical protein JTB14_006810 [Gonioctena quinquepunctata]